MTTRATILSRAFARIGITGYEFNVEPDERADARQMLDAMMAEWAASGVTLSYTPSEIDDDGEDMTTPAWADAPIWNNLAVRLAPEYGKQLSPGLSRDARRGYDLATAKTQVIPTVTRANSPIHGGGERYYRRFGW